MVMNHRPEVNEREGDIAKRVQSSFGGGAVGALILGGGIEAGNGFISLSQLAAQAKFEQDNETKSQEEQPGQAGNTLLIMQENRTNVEITTLEAGNTLLQAGLSAIGQDEVRVSIEAGGGIAQIDLPTKLCHFTPYNEPVNNRQDVPPINGQGVPPVNGQGVPLSTNLNPPTILPA